MRQISFKVKFTNLVKTYPITKQSIFLSKQKKYASIFSEQIANNIAARLLESGSSKQAFDRWVCLTIPSKNANLLPPVGPFLGQHGFNTMNFCTTFNNITKIFPDNLPLKVEIKLYSDKTIQFQLKTPPTSFLLYSAYFANNLNHITPLDVIKISLIKKIDNIDLSIHSLAASVLGTARSMKLKIQKNEN